jgi:hypothetical protein
MKRALLAVSSVVITGALQAQQSFEGVWILDRIVEETPAPLTAQGMAVQAAYDLLNDDPSLRCEPASLGRVWGNPNSRTGIHLVDLAIAILGPAEQVWARLATRASNFANGDTLGLMLAFPGGANALISAMLATPFEGRFAVYGRKGWVEIRDRTHPEHPTGWDVTTCIAGAADSGGNCFAAARADFVCARADPASGPGHADSAADSSAACGCVCNAAGSCVHSRSGGRACL